jgi:hypothetical protein
MWFTNLDSLVWQLVYGPQLTAEIEYNSTVNPRGIPGKGKPCDLPMEHLNKVFKDFHDPRASLTWVRAQSVVAGLLRDVSKASIVWRRE